MSDEISEKLKDFIFSKYKSMREFANEINIPYSTLDSIFKRGILNANVANIIKICKHLNISADFLAVGEIRASEGQSAKRTLSSDTQEVAEAYEDADLQHKNIVRLALGLKTIDTEFAEQISTKDMKTS